MNDLTRREQILAVQVKAHRFCVAQMADERARFEAEREAATARATEDAKARARVELAQERQTFEHWTAKERAAIDQQRSELARREAEVKQFHEHVEAERRRIVEGEQRPTAPTRTPLPGAEPTPLLRDLARRAVDFAAMVEVVTNMEQQLAEARAAHEAATQRHVEALEQRERELAQREAEAAARISATEAQLAAEREQVSQSKQSLATFEQEVKELRSELVRRQSDVTNAEQEIVAARQEAMAMLKSAAHTREELDQTAAKLKSEGERLARAEQAQLKIRNEVDLRARTVGEETAALEENRKRMAQELGEARERAAALDKQRTDLETQRAAMQTEAAALEQRLNVFEERQRKFRDRVATLLND